MKKILTLLLIVGIALTSYAQKFQLTDPNGTPYTNGQTINIDITHEDLTAFDEYVVKITIKNTSTEDLNMRTIRENIAIAVGMFAYVCFGVCDETGEMLAMDCPIFEGGQDSFDLHLAPRGKFGLCQFKVDFMVPDESMTLYININVQELGVGVYDKKNASLSAFPNPTVAHSLLNVAYTLADRSHNNRLVVRNIVGGEVMNLPLNPNQNSITIDISSLVAGVYFYAIEDKKQIVIAKKLIVK